MSELGDGNPGSELDGPLPEVLVALTEAEASLARLRAASLDACSDDQVEDVLRRWERLRRQNTMVDVALVGQLDSRGVPFRRGCKTTAVYLSQALRLAPREARRRVVAWERFGVRTCGSLTAGPVYASVAAALADGTISVEHSSVIARTIEKLPDEVAAEHDTEIESLLLEQAATLHPADLAKAGERLRYLVDQDGRFDELAHQEKVRQVSFSRRADGTGRIEGDLTVEAAELVETCFDALASPAPAEDGTPDPRSPGQRRHDALAELARLAMKAKLVPRAGGVTTTLILHMDAHTYATSTATASTGTGTTGTGASGESGTALTGHGYTIPAALAKQWIEAGGDAETRVIAVLLDKTRRVEAYSSTHRIYTEQQRLALMARDLGCTFPTCDTDPLHTQTHHLVDYQHGGPTTLDNAALLCAAHHRDFQQMGWEGTGIDGTPHWNPPTWIDPNQTPTARPRPERPRPS